MAKQDFCFTYYDGDAARDKAHMSRLERGAYDDIISAQRKRGHLSVEDIQKVLSRDFEACWPSLEWVLLKDDDGKYFIEWVDKSVSKMVKHSKKQSEKAAKRWGGNAKEMPRHNSGSNLAMPLENEYGNEIELEKRGAGGKGENDSDDKFYPDKSMLSVELEGDDFDNTVVYLESTTKQKIDNLEVERMWKGFKIQYFNGKTAYDDWLDVKNHFRDWFKKYLLNNKNPRNELTNQQQRKPNRSEAGQLAVLNDLKAELGLTDGT